MCIFWKTTGGDDECFITLRDGFWVDDNGSTVISLVWDDRQNRATGFCGPVIGARDGDGESAVIGERSAVVIGDGVVDGDGGGFTGCEEIEVVAWIEGDGVTALKDRRGGEVDGVVGCVEGSGGEGSGAGLEAQDIRCVGIGVIGDDINGEGSVFCGVGGIGNGGWPVIGAGDGDGESAVIGERSRAVVIGDDVVDGDGGGFTGCEEIEVVAWIEGDGVTALKDRRGGEVDGVVGCVEGSGGEGSGAGLEAQDIRCVGIGVIGDDINGEGSVFCGAGGISDSGGAVVGVGDDGGGSGGQ